MDNNPVQDNCLLGIATKPYSKAPMELHERINIGLEFGLEGDYRGSKSKRRQVTLLNIEEWEETCEQLGMEIPWQERRANLLIRGHRFDSKDIGHIVRIGEVELEITTDTPPCRRLDPLHPGLVDLLRGTWKAGASAKVLKGGRIQIGDRITIEPPPPSPQLAMDV